MKYYHERLSIVWVLFRLPAILLLAYIRFFDASYFVMLAAGIFFFVDLLHFMNRNGLNLIVYLKNGFRSWGCLFTGRSYGNPVIGISDTTLKIRNNSFPLASIQRFYPGLGGSEPYIVFHDGHRIDLDLSWLTRKDRNEVQAKLQASIATDAQ